MNDHQYPRRNGWTKIGGKWRKEFDGVMVSCLPDLSIEGAEWEPGKWPGWASCLTWMIQIDEAYKRHAGLGEWQCVGHLMMLDTEKGVYQIRRGMDGVWDAFILVPHDTEIVWVASRNCLKSLQEACERDSRGEKI